VRAHCLAFSLSGTICEHIEGSEWKFRVAELFSYDFPSILHCVGAEGHSEVYSEELMEELLEEVSEEVTVEHSKDHSKKYSEDH